MNRTRGFTLVELLVVIAIIALLISLLLPALGKAIKNSRSIKDGTQSKEIHQAMLTYAVTDDGRFPTPGRINRLEDIESGTQIPGLGPEDNTRNTTQALYSVMVAQELVPVTILVGPTEVNPVVMVKEDYDFDAYNPGMDTYWDTSFVMRINSAAAGAVANASYAHMQICGRRKKEKWRDNGSSGDPVIGNRGVGEAPGIEVPSLNSPEVLNSPVLQLHDPPKQFIANVCFNDNHYERTENFYSGLTNYDPGGGEAPIKDAMWTAEFVPAGGSTGGGTPNHRLSDAFLGVGIAAHPSGDAMQTIVFDALLSSP